MTGVEPPRVPVTSNLRDVGVINWIILRGGARRIRAPQFHLFNALSRHPLLFWSWLPFGGATLYWGALSRKDAEVVILRVGHLRNSVYELQQHRRLARTRGLDTALQDKIFEGPDADGLSDRHRVLVKATDEFVLDRVVSPETWTALASHFNRKQLIEICFLAGQYDMLAATIATLQPPLDFPD